jgi:hypothetical protein
MAVANQPSLQLDASGRLRSRSCLLDMLKMWLHNPVSVDGIFLALFIVAVGVCAPVLAPSENSSAPCQVSRPGFQAVLQPPDALNPFETTQGQYDPYYGVAGGTIIAFGMSIGVTLYGQRTRTIFFERGRSMAVIHLDSYHLARKRV